LDEESRRTVAMFFTKKQFTSEMFSSMLGMLWLSTNALGMESTIQETLNRDEMERRRLEAAQDLLNGITQSQVARKFGVSRTTASRWQRALKGSGVESLRKRRAPGRPSRLTREQLNSLADLMAQGASTYGFPDDRWTTARLSVAISVRYGVRYDPDHVGRLMHKMGLRKTEPAVIEMPVYAASRYSPNTDLSRSEISPTVA
jgi:transposase